MSCRNTPKKNVTLHCYFRQGNLCTARLVCQFFLFYHKLLHKITNTPNVALPTWLPDHLATILTPLGVRPISEASRPTLH